MDSYTPVTFDRDMYLELMLYCNAADLLCLRRTSRYWKATVDSFMKRAYNICSQLSHFFQSPLLFRIMQSNTGAVISGSFAFQFFTRSNHPTHELDIYVRYELRKFAGDYLISDGYRYYPVFDPDNLPHRRQPRSYQEAIESLHNAQHVAASYCPGVLGVLKFKKLVNGQLRKVQLLVVEICPIRTILSFHSSM